MFAAGKYALGICDRCGLTFKLLTLRNLRVSGVLTHTKVCNDCYEDDHPQNAIPRAKADAEALRDPRSDLGVKESRNVTWGWKPVYGLEVKGEIGKVETK